MSQPKEITFQFGDGASHNASIAETSAVINFCFNHYWSLVPEFTGLNGSPTYSIEVSNDLVIWNPYDTPTEDSAINQGFDDNHLNFKHMRINYKDAGNTTGTVEFTIVLK